MRIWKGKTGKFIPLVVIIMLLCTITIMCIVCAGLDCTQEKIAQLDKDIDTNEEQISAETITNYGSYTVPKDGIYKVELHGGHGTDSQGNYVGGNGSKVTGYVRLSRGNVLTATRYEGGSRCKWLLRRRR